MTIWKYTIGPNPAKVTELIMPEGAKVISCMMQQGSPCLWALVDPEAPKVVRLFHLFATGEPFDANGLTYIGTYQIDGYYMFHLFEESTQK